MLYNSSSYSHKNIKYYRIICRCFDTYIRILIRLSSISNFADVMFRSIYFFALYRNNSTSYDKTIQKGSFHDVRKISLDMGRDLAIVGIQQNNTIEKLRTIRLQKNQLIQ